MVSQTLRLMAERLFKKPGDRHTRHKALIQPWHILAKGVAQNRTSRMASQNFPPTAITAKIQGEDMT